MHEDYRWSFGLVGRVVSVEREVDDIAACMCRGERAATWLRRRNSQAPHCQGLQEVLSYGDLVMEW